MIKEAESAWDKVVTTVNTIQPSDVFESNFLPLFAESVSGFDPVVQGESSFIDENSL